MENNEQDKALTDDFMLHVASEISAHLMGQASEDDVRLVAAILKQRFSATAETIAAALHFPQCWDVAAYPTMANALTEIGQFKCSECSQPSAQPIEQKPEAASWRALIAGCMRESFRLGKEHTNAGGRGAKEIDTQIESYIDRVFAEAISLAAPQPSPTASDVPGFIPEAGYKFSRVTAQGLDEYGDHCIDYRFTKPRALKTSPPITGQAGEVKS